LKLVEILRMNNIVTYAKLLRIRNTFKKVQNLSWTVSKLEQKYDIDGMDGQTSKEMLDAYEYLVKDIKNILVELQNEYVETTDNNRV